MCWKLFVVLWSLKYLRGIDQWNVNKKLSKFIWYMQKQIQHTDRFYTLWYRIVYQDPSILNIVYLYSIIQTIVYFYLDLSFLLLLVELENSMKMIIRMAIFLLKLKNNLDSCIKIKQYLSRKMVKTPVLSYGGNIYYFSNGYV